MANEVLCDLASLYHFRPHSLLCLVHAEQAPWPTFQALKAPQPSLVKAFPFRPERFVCGEHLDLCTNGHLMDEDFPDPAG